MTEKEVTELATEALSETPGKAAHVSLVLKRGHTWLILLKDGDDELAFGIDDVLNSDQIKRAVVQEVRKLF